MPDFDVQLQGLPDPLNKRAKGATPQEISYLAKLSASEQRIAMMPKMPFTVVNLNPYPLVVLGPLFDGLTVKANQTGKRFNALVISEVKYEIDTGLDRNHTPIEFWPVQLATEFVTRYEQKGGVFCISGDLSEHPELENTAEFKRLYDKADSRLVVYCRQLKKNADGEWNSPNHANARNIHPPHRQAARILHDRGLLTELPPWMSGDIEISDVTADCPSCRAKTKKDQAVCSCQFILDPYQAFMLGAIDEFHAALERLTRKQVEELNVSAYVAETLDERPARLKEGKAKPFSKFEVQQQAALDAEKKKAKDK